MNTCWGKILMTVSIAVLIIGCEVAEKRANIIVNEVQIEHDPLEKREVQKIYNKGNLAKAQLYRMLSMIEINQNSSHKEGLQSLLSDIFINSDNFIEDLVSSEQFSRIKDGQIIVQELEIQNVSESLLTLVALVKNKSSNKSNSEAFETLRIKADMVCLFGELPLFTSFNISDVSTNTLISSEKVVSQEQNRALSTIYYWMGLLEELEGEVKPFKTILEPEFQMNFSTGTQISSLEKMDGWLNARSILLIDSRYDIYEIQASLNDQNQIVVTIEVDWNGITRDNNLMTARTNEKWILSNDNGKDFPQVVKIEVEQLAPFTIVNS